MKQYNYKMTITHLHAINMAFSRVSFKFSHGEYFFLAYLCDVCIYRCADVYIFL